MRSNREQRELKEQRDFQTCLLNLTQIKLDHEQINTLKLGFYCGVIRNK